MISIHAPDFLNALTQDARQGLKQARGDTSIRRARGIDTPRTRHEPCDLPGDLPQRGLFESVRP